MRRCSLLVFFPVLVLSTLIQEVVFRFQLDSIVFLLFHVFSVMLSDDMVCETPWVGLRLQPGWGLHVTGQVVRIWGFLGFFALPIGWPSIDETDERKWQIVLARSSTCLGCRTPLSIVDNTSRKTVYSPFSILYTLTNKWKILWC